MSKTIELVCDHCKNNYIILLRRYNQKVKKGTKTFFCSNSCSFLHRRLEKINIFCKHCQVPLVRIQSEILPSGNTFCSRSCAATHNNKQGKARNPKKERHCINCSKSYYWANTNRTKYCEQCRPNKPIIHKRTLKECLEQISLKGKHPSWKTTYVRNANHSFNKDIKGTPCQVCGYSHHTELAHIKAVAEFDENSILEEINSPNNILVLCPNHHWEFDHKILLLDQIPPRLIPGPIR